MGSVNLLFNGASMITDINTQFLGMKFLCVLKITTGVTSLTDDLIRQFFGAYGSNVISAFFYAKTPTSSAALFYDDNDLFYVIKDNVYDDKEIIYDVKDQGPSLSIQANLNVYDVKEIIHDVKEVIYDAKDKRGECQGCERLIPTRVKVKVGLGMALVA